MTIYTCSPSTNVGYVCSQRNWDNVAFEVTDALEASTMLPDGFIIVLSSLQGLVMPTRVDVVGGDVAGALVVAAVTVVFGEWSYRLLQLPVHVHCTSRNVV